MSETSHNLNSLSGAARVDAIASEFTRRWSAGTPPQIATFLDLIDAAQRETLLRRLVKLDLDFRRRRGDEPESSDYGALPGISAVLFEFFPSATVDLPSAEGEQPSNTVGPGGATVHHRGHDAPVPEVEATLDGTQEWVTAGPPPVTGLPASFAGGRYRVTRKLGGGGQKTALLALDTELDREVVVAVLRGEALDSASLGRLRSEARSMARLDDHPHIVGIHDIGEEDGHPYFVCQYVEGGSVADRLRQHETELLPLSETIKIAEQVCLALDYAHQREIVHRDVKPDNVWLTPEGIAKLGDFGLAAPLDRSRLTGTGDTVGTAAYMPPEQALGADVGPQSDLYSLGVMLYEMVTGRHPFAGESMLQVISQHVNAAPVPPIWHNPQIGQSLNALILQLLAKVLEDRPRSAAAVREVLLTLAEQAAEPASSVPPQQRSVEQLAAGAFVGRHSELEELRASLDEGVVGRSQILLLSGDPGSGKSRTAVEVRTYARLRNMDVIGGRCFEGKGAPAFWPWLQIMRAYAGDRGPAQLADELGPVAADLAQLDPEMRQRLPELPPPPQMAPEQARFRLFDGIATFLRNAVQKTPLLLILDDLQWADEASLKLLEFISAELRDCPLVVLGLHRNVNLGRRHPLTRTLSELAREPHCKRIQLGGLSYDDVGQIVLSTAGIVPPPALLQAVWEKTEGNPFFVSEIIRLLAEQGQLADLDDNLDDLTISIPESVRDVIGNRIDRLSDDCRETLTMASAVGREFALQLVEQISELDGDEILDALEEAETARLVVEETDQERYSFTHDLIRETLYGEIRKSSRARLHARIGAGIEELFAGDLAPHYAELAEHYSRSAKRGTAEQAVRYASLARERSLEQLAYEEAVRFGELALKADELRETADQALRCQLECALGEAQRGAGRLADALETFERTAELARELHSADHLARAALGYFQASWQAGNLGNANVGLFDEALGALPAQDSPLRARLLAGLSRSLRYVGQLTAADGHANRAVEMARRIGDPELLAFNLNSLHETRWGPEHASSRLALAREHAAATRQIGPGERMLESRVLLLLSVLELGDLPATRDSIEGLTNLASELRQPFFSYAATVVHTMEALFGGRYAEATQLAQQSRDLGRRVRPDHFEGTFGLHMFTICKEQGRLGEVALVINQLVKDDPAAAGWRPALAVLLAELDFREQAQQQFEKLAVNDFTDIPQDGLWSVSMSYLAEVCRYLGDADRAERLFALLKPHAELNVVAAGAVVCYGSTARYLGQLAATMQRWDDAEDYFQQSLEMNRRMAARPYEAHTQHEFAEMLLHRQQNGDRAWATALLEAARDTAADLQLRTLEKQVVMLLAK